MELIEGGNLTSGRDKGSLYLSFGLLAF